MRAAFNRVMTMNKKVLVRSVVLLVFTTTCFGLLELLISMGGHGANSINQKFPELLIMLRGGAIYTWAEVSVFWIRVTLQPNIDMQESAKKAEETPMSAAVLQGIQQLAWAVRIGLLLWVTGFLGGA